ncbi:hypothetical protein IJH02_01000 [Candidatus Saccharibacteria bacterium]|nr:hypothetical protein [Candidatus Saccharibacteria bacterium]
MTLTAKLKKRFYFIAAAYFRFFANFAFKRWNPRVIAITGSVGKTTMLHLVEAELGKEAHYSHDANSAFGIAFDLVGLRGITGSKLRWFYLIVAVPIRSIFYKRTEKYYMVEIDGERPHETEFLAKWLRPEVTIWISLGRSHAVQFEGQVKDGTFENLDKAITHEFAMLPQYTRKKIFIDGDIPLMVKSTEKIKKKNLTKAEIVACYKSDLAAYSVYPNHADFVVNGNTFHFEEPMPKDIAIQLVMLEKLSKYLRIPLKTDFSEIEMPPGRNSYFEGKNGLKIIDSSYNAHLISMESILGMAKSLHARHKWLVIGDMVEQGSIEKEEHKKLADLIAEAGPEQVILVGRRTKKYTAPKLKELGTNYIAVDDPKSALMYIEKHVTGKETIIFKGSQYLEWVIEKLLKNPEDTKRLPRREPAAEKRREKRGLE